MENLLAYLPLKLEESREEKPKKIQVGKNINRTIDKCGIRLKEMK